jgi:hypothetical protein
MMPTNTDTQEVERAISAEQTADLAALRAAAAGGDVPPGEVATSAPPPRDLAGELAGLVSLAVATLSPVFPSLKAIYTEPVTNTAAQAIAAVCHKHGWCQDGVMGRWGEEIACAAIVLPLAWQTSNGIKADIKARQPAPDPAAPTAALDLSAPAPTAAPGQKTVTFG